MCPCQNNNITSNTFRNPNYSNYSNVNLNTNTYRNANINNSMNAIMNNSMHNNNFNVSSTTNNNNTYSSYSSCSSYSQEYSGPYYYTFDSSLRTTVRCPNVYDVAYNSALNLRANLPSGAFSGNYF